ncbi:MAG: DUF1800 family protein [Ramlibacter sp.]
MKNLPHALALCAALAAALPAGADAPSGPAAWRAMSRFGYGPSPSALTAAGPAWALQQLDLAAAAARAPATIPAELAGFNAPLTRLYAQFREERAAQRQVRAEADAAPPPAARTYFSRDVARQAAAWRLAACSRTDVENPLLARMTEFWFNHLNVFVGKGAVRPFTGHYAVNAIRPHALGRFEDLLLASARHPAMLLYLDQAQSVAEGAPGGRGLNENYARELLELHTLGVNGGYTQTDVRELARILTGWTVDPRSDSGFRFAPRLHDGGAKTLLGQRFEAAGVQEGEAAIRLLARHPATAQRISLRLAQWFVADQPPPALVQRLAQRYTATQGDIAAVMRVLIESPETWDNGNRLFKTPLDYTCSVLAATGGVQNERELNQALGFLASAGQPLHGWQTPDGYKTDAATWLSPEALSRRADFAFAVGRRVDDAATLTAWLAPATRARIAQEPPRLQAGLALASPDYMYK